MSLGRTQKMGVTKSGRLITWEVCVNLFEMLLFHSMFYKGIILTDVIFLGQLFDL